MNSKIGIFCVAHKPLGYDLPEGYIELGVGSHTNAQFFTGTGDHINEKNHRYSEVSAVYWILNNLDLSYFDFIGLVHYRRFFHADLNPSGSKKTPVVSCSISQWNQVRTALSSEKFRSFFKGCEGIAPVPQNFGRSIRNFYSEKHENRVSDLELAYKVAIHHGLFSSDKAAEELDSPRLTPYCMSFLKASLWIDIWRKILSTLLEIESVIPGSEDPYQNRNMGFLAERLHSSAIAQIEANGHKILRAPVLNVGFTPAQRTI